MVTQAPPIRRQLMRMMLLTSVAVLLVTSSSFFAYELLTFRQSSVQQLNTLGRAIAANSSAALAFDNAEDAETVLDAFGADPHIVAAALYDTRGVLFAIYPKGMSPKEVPMTPETGDDHRFDGDYLVGFQPVTEGTRRLGTLYVKSNLTALNERIRLYAWVVALVIGVSVLLAYVLSRRLQHQISRPILALAETATAVSERSNYSVRARRPNMLELDQLTDAFNHMLEEVQQSQSLLRAQLGHLELLQHVTRAIGDRQDMASIFTAVLQTVEKSLAIEFGCALRHDEATNSFVVSTAGAGTLAGVDVPSLSEGALIPVAVNFLDASVAGETICENDIAGSEYPLFRTLAGIGLGSIVIAPLVVKNSCFGALLIARRPGNSFTVAECHFLSQLSDHVALAAQQAQLYTALQQAYDELRQTQHTVMQQERLRALGQMASGIAHDINNAISPVALYTESLLEREPNLSERARSNLITIQRAIDDVAGTVARMREFYRERETQLTLAKVDLNEIAQQAVELTQARWSDLPQQRGIVVHLCLDLSPVPAEVMAAGGELRDALTNLIFNAVDAMPEGGTLSLRTRCVELQGDANHWVHIEVGDTGIGMDEETRRRCLEPFFTTKGERGTGLGLPMVYGMVQRHSAELQIDSEPSVGSTFRLIFPAIVQFSPATVRLPTLHLATRRLRILVVDDDPMLIRTLEDILTADGHLVTTANGGRAGIDTFAAALSTSSRFDLVITDLGMPGIDGRKVAESVKHASPATPVVMLTGWGQRLLAEGDIPSCVDRLLAKPPRLQQLRLAMFELTAPPGEQVA